MNSMFLSNKNLAFLAFSIFLVAFFSLSCAKKQVVKKRVYREAGYASWYGPGFHGRKTASGTRFNQNHMTAAHKKLPFGSRVKVTKLDTNKSIIVKINDRGPFKPGRIIDLSKAAAKEIGLLASGVSKVVIEVLPKYTGEKKE